MKISEFQFKTPFLKHLQFDFNLDFNPDNNFSIVQEFSNSIMKSDDSNGAIVELNMVLNAKDNTPFNVDIVMVSEFSWDDSVDENQLDDLLRINASTLLVSYMRPIVAIITASSPLPGYQIPFINFSEITEIQ